MNKKIKRFIKKVGGGIYVLMTIIFVSLVIILIVMVIIGGIYGFFQLAGYSTYPSINP